MANHTRLGLIFLAITAIVAVVGLILMFSRHAGPTHLGIGETYRGGIAPTQETPAYVRSGSGAQPVTEYPALTQQGTLGTTPLLRMFAGEHAAIEDVSRCFDDLTWLIPAPQEAVTCYGVTRKGTTYQVLGRFPPTSASRAGFEGRMSEILCWQNTPYDRDAMFSRLKGPLTQKGWSVGTLNNKEILDCRKGAFAFPQ